MIASTVTEEGATPGTARLERTRYLESWRTSMKKLVDTSSMTKELIHRIGVRTIERWDDPPDDVDDDTIRMEKLHFIALGTRQQTALLLPKIEKKGAPQRELFLLNETYSVNGETMKLGEMTPIQVERYVYAELQNQIKDIRKKWREIKKLVSKCRYRSRPIKDQ